MSDDEDLALLRERNRRLAAEVDHMRRVLERKNRELDALHVVWCDGGCPGGVHRFQDGEVLVTEELVAAAERNTTRLRHWYEVVKFKVETYGPDPADPSRQFPGTASEWHRQYAARAAAKTDLALCSTPEFPFGETRVTARLRGWDCPAPALRQCRRAPAAQKAGPRLPATMKRPRSAFRQAGAASCSVGPVTTAQDILLSDVSRLGDLPLDAEVNIGDAEYAHIMRRAGVAEGEPGASVSAFNSSI